jgi:hypothetical protein
MRLTVVVAKASPGVVVRRDGTELAPAAWSVAIPTDPGTHEIRADAPGRQPWSRSVTLSKAGESTTVEVPELATAPASPPPPPAPVAAASPAPELHAAASTEPPPASDADQPHGRSKILAWTLLGAGVAVGVAGGVLMAVEAGKAANSRANNDVPEYNATVAPYYVGLGGVIAGSLAAAGGIVLFALPGSAKESAGASTATVSVQRIGWSALPGGGSVGIGGSW